ncbi:MAG: hypothetical protein AVDCRST_MAG10-794, partial [uncultured Acidimicrobiales bacterium]
GEQLQRSGVVPLAGDLRFPGRDRRLPPAPSGCSEICGAGRRRSGPARAPTDLRPAGVLRRRRRRPGLEVHPSGRRPAGHRRLAGHRVLAPDPRRRRPGGGRPFRPLVRRCVAPLGLHRARGLGPHPVRLLQGGAQHFEDRPPAGGRWRPGRGGPGRRGSPKPV